MLTIPRIMYFKELERLQVIMNSTYNLLSKVRLYVTNSRFPSTVRCCQQFLNDCISRLLHTMLTCVVRSLNV